jgi:putative endonuclease
LYIGQTNDVERRFAEHQRGKHSSTRNRGPWQLIFQVKFETREEAVALERKLKGMKRPDRVVSYLKKLV